MKRFPKYLCSMAAATMVASMTASTPAPTFGTTDMAALNFGKEQPTIPLRQTHRAPVVAQDLQDLGSPITEAPAGKYVPCYVDYSMCWFMAAGGAGLSGFPLMGKPMHYVVTDDNEVYLYNPVFLRPFGGDDQQLGTYIKGTLEGRTVTFQFPQPAGEVDVHDNGTVVVQAYYNKMVAYETGEGGNAYIPAVDEENYITYDMDEEGNLTMEYMDEAYQDMLGLSTDDEAWIADQNTSWIGSGTWQWSAKVIDPTPLTPPSDMEIMSWTMKDDMYGTVFVNVGIDGDDFWIQGLSRTYLPDAWAKGKIEDNMVTFPRCEFIGEATSVGQYAWVAGSLFDEDLEYDENGEAIISSSALFDLQFEINEDFSVLTAKKRVVINPNTIIYYALESYNHVVLTKLPDDFEPLPQPAEFTSFDVYEDGTSELWFKYNRNTADGIPLETNKLFYEIYTPDQELYTFTPEVYPALEEDMNLIPRGSFISGVFMAQGSNINVKLNIPGIDNIGVRTVYITDGERYESEVVYYTELNGSGVSKLMSDGNIAYEYYTLTGQKVTKPEKGCFIKVTRLNDGTRKAEKVIF
ncbi:MAG: hypothetical protein HDR88_16695 [Bacteroides sp.]|nr:hypothetical protein [Bacteroides sp.]